jgi:hypothetical protein
MSVHLLHFISAKGVLSFHYSIMSCLGCDISKSSQMHASVGASRKTRDSMVARCVGWDAC